MVCRQFLRCSVVKALYWRALWSYIWWLLAFTRRIHDNQSMHLSAGLYMPFIKCDGSWRCSTSFIYMVLCVILCIWKASAPFDVVDTHFWPFLIKLTNSLASILKIVCNQLCPFTSCIQETSQLKYPLIYLSTTPI